MSKIVQKFCKFSFFLTPLFQGFCKIFKKSICNKNICNPATETNNKKILIVDDHDINLIALKTKIEKLLPLTTCDIANGGKEAIKKTQKNSYDLIVMDLQMPDMDGIETSKLMRKNLINTPIIIATSLSYETFLEEIKKRGGVNYATDYVTKTAPSNYLMRAIAKNILDYEDGFYYLNNDKELIAEALKNKKVVLADDQDLNRVMTGRILEKYKIITTDAKSGKEVIDLYKNSLDEAGISNLDAIITDINMEPINGYEASDAIRKIELENKILFVDRIPIVAITGDNSSEVIKKLFKSGINDYFIKGNNFNNLANVLANFFIDIDKKGGSLEIDGSKLEFLSKKSSNDEVFNSSFIDNFDDSEKSKIIKLFLDDSKNIVANIKKYSLDQKSELLNINIHSLKGIVANIGAEKLSNYIKLIDKNVKLNSCEEGWFDKMEKLYEELTLELRKYL